ncbi:MAG: hypothetical protein COB08_009470 [Rhodobacteraceae bacterium]|nr:hypothetical protein [Paracoccaceae bacterium]
MNKFFSLTLPFLLLFSSSQAFAACTSPAGGESQTRYDFTAHKLYYCDNTNWIESGGGGGSGSDHQVFTASGTWTKPAALGADSIVTVEVWGGGASGGSSSSGTDMSGGGGGGAYTTKIFRAGDLTAAVAITVGAGGVGSSGNSGCVAGAASSFGGYLSAPGGPSCPNGSIPRGVGGYGASPLAGSSADRGLNGAVSNNGLHNGGSAVSGGGGGIYENTSDQYLVGTGGSSVYGGGGGGASPANYGSYYDGGSGAGGISLHGGNGGSGATNVADATNGGIPSGGGIGDVRSGAAGSGGRGEVRVYSTP